MASRPTISSRPPTGTAANPVRRNLFQGHLIRRPTGASASTSATTLNEARQEDRNDILVKDRNGNAQVQTLLPPSLDEDRPQEEEEDLRTDKESGLALFLLSMIGVLICVMDRDGGAPLGSIQEPEHCSRRPSWLVTSPLPWNRRGDRN